MSTGLQSRIRGITRLLSVSLWLAGAAGAQNIVVDAAPSHAVNSFSPFRALGGAIDRLRGGNTKAENEKHTERLLTDPVLKELLGAGWQTVTYRQNTELMIEAWHWNARGTWSNAAKQEGYFTGSAEPTSEKILHSWAYPLPHRGATLGDGNGWSRLTDGDPKSYWKSNPYLTQAYTGEADSLHPQWVMIDLGAKLDVNAIKISWANPYAKRYYLQFWTGEQEPFYDGINKGAWQTFPMGTVAGGKGGTPTLKLMSWNIPVRYLRIWMTESSNTCDRISAIAWDMRSTNSISGPWRRTANSRTSSSTFQAGSRPSRGLPRWTPGTPPPIWITEEGTKSDSISSSIAG